MNEITEILNAFAQLGGEAKAAFIWWLAYKTVKTLAVLGLVLFFVQAVRKLIVEVIERDHAENARKDEYKQFYLAWLEKTDIKDKRTYEHGAASQGILNLLQQQHAFQNENPQLWQQFCSAGG